MKFIINIFNKLKEKRAAVIAWIIFFICPAVTYYLFEFYIHNPFETTRRPVQGLNIVFFEILALLFVGIFGRIRTALMVHSGIFMVFGLANYYVLTFRGTPIMPWDIYSLSTAASVADNFDYSLQKDTILVIAGFLVLLAVESRIKYRGSRHLCKRVILTVIPFLMLFGFTKMVQNDSFVVNFGLYDKLFTPTYMHKRDGNMVAFLMEMEYLQVDKPDGYSAEKAEQLLAQYGSEQLEEAVAHPESVSRPNIIVIMNEAFSDLSVLGEFETNEDYMPFIRSLQQDEDVISGYLNVSVIGGNTATTEFEFLTGHSMAFLPQGSVAYQQYLKSEGASLPSYLKSLGYSTVAIHPYHASGWERDRVYPLLGFDEFIDLKKISTFKKVRNYVSDEACYDKIRSLNETKEDGTPLFVFNVTMQNHSGYTEEFSNFTPDVKIDGIESGQLEQYLSLLKKSDEAFRELVEYFSEQEEDTLILFFGDHQPTTYLTNPIVKNSGRDPYALTQEENLLRYKVPYLIWSNFDLKGQSVSGETSVNYLAIDVLESCGLPLPEYQSLLKEVREEYPIVTGLQIRDKDGELCIDGEKSQKEQEQDEAALLPYQTLQYYLLFDRS